VDDNADPAHLSTHKGRRPGIARRLWLRAGTQFDFRLLVRELGFDDRHFKAFRQSGVPAMLSMKSRLLAPSESGGSAPTGGPDLPAKGDARADAQTDAQAAALPSAPGLLDAAALARLSELDPTGANHLLERVLKAFEASVTRLRPQLDAARLSNDRAAIRLVSHTFKSSSASIGALHLSQLCARIETAVRLDDNEHLEADLDAMNAALDEAMVAISNLLKDRT
jgi:HPt (histidine-containing phosphotransfer) domain-containing protein